MRFVHAHLDRHETVNDREIAIFERSVLDVLAYAKVNGNLHPNWQRLLLRLARQELSLFDVYFYIPPDIPIVGDGIRSTAPRTREKIDIAIKSLLNTHRPSCVLLRGSRKERVDAAMRIIQGPIRDIVSGSSEAKRKLQGDASGPI